MPCRLTLILGTVRLTGVSPQCYDICENRVHRINCIVNETNTYIMTPNVSKAECKAQFAVVVNGFRRIRQRSLRGYLKLGLTQFVLPLKAGIIKILIKQSYSNLFHTCEACPRWKIQVALKEFSIGDRQPACSNAACTRGLLVLRALGFEVNMRERSLSPGLFY